MESSRIRSFGLDMTKAMIQMIRSLDADRGDTRSISAVVGDHSSICFSNREANLVVRSSIGVQDEEKRRIPRKRVLDAFAFLLRIDLVFGYLSC